MTENEKSFIKAFVDFEANVKNAQSYIKEEYNVSSEYNEEDNTLKLYCEGETNSLNLITAKAFINESFADMGVNVLF